MAYFSDQEVGSPAPTLDDLPARAWGGIVATFHRMAEAHYFAQDFPAQCEDGKGVKGTNMAALLQLMLSHVPDFEGWPRADELPTTVAAMDLVVFGWRHAAKPKAVGHHQFFGHDHLHFNRDQGRAEWRQAINEILQRNRVALRQEGDGRVVRVGPAAAQLVTHRPVPSSGNAELDAKVATALRKYQNPDVVVRREAMEALWDAFERVKTLLHPNDKKASTEALVALMAPGVETRVRLTADFQDLTKIGNDFQIRHHETSKHAIDDAVLDHWFVRMFSLVERAIRAVVASQGGTGP